MADIQQMQVEMEVLIMYSGQYTLDSAELPSVGNKCKSQTLFIPTA
ncbi:hypothetical protein L915_16627 [Phytophthora nicotianae]|uniref:Uncharacterized protein n=1 Tax=Phytophthora nicotianae TaxID=4792 RepID=W2IAI6_PHYNI|nr:hypothetical protein L915_16627 [Phytophthora nicotianae]ETL30492.1 hypothetical protein L916_16531 [Phytophthora nicotianae]ETM36940.1 hypothetical protein L914_16460 [Phytophthora nicotianae]